MVLTVENQRTNGPVNAHLISEKKYKKKPWLQITEGFLVQAFILISELCSAKVKGTIIYFHLLIKFTISTDFQAHAAKLSIIVAFSCRKA